MLLLAYYGLLQQPYGNTGKVLFSTTTIARLAEDTPAYQSGLRPGDTILSVNGRRVLMDTDLTLEMQNDADGVLQMVVRRPTQNGSEKVTLDAVRFTLATDEKTGRQYLQYDFVVLGKERTLGNTFVQAAREDLSVATVVWITVNLGVLNLLPLPALDGGRLVFLLWEAVTRRPVPAKWEGLVHFIGLILLLLLMLVITYSDITKFFA